MRWLKASLFLLLTMPMLVSCVSKKQYDALQAELDLANETEEKCAADMNRLTRQLSTCEQERTRLSALLEGREAQMEQLRDQLADARSQPSPHGGAGGGADI